MEPGIYERESALHSPRISTRLVAYALRDSAYSVLPLNEWLNDAEEDHDLTADYPIIGYEHSKAFVSCIP